jgi:hypothetical protein
MKLEFCRQNLEKFLSIKSRESRCSGSQAFHGDGQTDVTKLIVAFRNFANTGVIQRSPMDCGNSWSLGLSLSATVLSHLIDSILYLSQPKVFVTSRRYLYQNSVRSRAKRLEGSIGKYAGGVSAAVRGRWGDPWDCSPRVQHKASG